MESIEIVESGDIVVSFKSRAAAEQVRRLICRVQNKNLNWSCYQGMSKGYNVPTVGTIQLSWHTGKQSTAATISTSTSPGAADHTSAESERLPSPEQATLHSSRVQEEEVVASGWGEDGDGEDGMGML
jgi:RNA-binding protein 26